MSTAPNLANALVTLSDEDWNETAVRRVLHTFAYGGAAPDSQITTWSAMAPDEAIQEMFTFDRDNPELSPVPEQDATPDHAESLAALQAFWSSDHPDNLTCPSERGVYAETNTRADGNVVLRNAGLQQTWIAAVRKRGLNPFRHKVGFWLVNYQMAVNLQDTKPPLIQEHYDSALDALERGAPFHEVLATGATSAAVAREYGHRTNTYNNNTGVFRGNDDFAREFHQLFFRINGDIEEPDYHENTTIEHTAWALTGMRIDKEPNAYGTTRTQDWWLAPIDFTDHFDETGRRLRNFTLHHRDPLEILHANIDGLTAEDKLFNLAAVAIEHPESLDNIPVAIVNFFADDNLNDEKVDDIRAAWFDLAGQPDDLLDFLRAYAISTAFHREDTYKYRTAFSRNMTIYGLNTVDNEEAYGNSYTPLTPMRLQGAEAFIPVHDVFGGQTSLNAANNPSLFKEAYNRAVDFPNNLAKTVEVCRDDAGARLWTWRKDWARAIPTSDAGLYTVKEVGEWLWERFIGDGGEGYGPLEQAHVAALLATGMDLGYLADPTNADVAYGAADLNAEPLGSLVTANNAVLMELDNPANAPRREANRRVGMAINFITMTPAMFATGGVAAVAPASVTVPDVVGLAQAAAEAAITAAGLTLGTVTTQSSDTVPAGDVISQNPAAGASVASGSAVDLVVSSGPATSSDSLTCKKVEYKREKDRFSIEVRTTDTTGARTMTAVMDVDGNGTFERDLGVIPIKRGSTVTYKRDYRPFADPNPNASSVVRLTSDGGGVCTRNVKID
jgi:hypothetical protein